jgi:hypothetical protein
MSQGWSGDSDELCRNYVRNLIEADQKHGGFRRFGFAD